MSEYLLLLVSAVFVNNIILARYLGNCPFLGVSNRLDTAVGMSMAVVFVITLASAATWIVQTYVLTPFDLEYLQTIAFILIIATLVQLVEMFLQKSIPTLYRALGIFLPLITTNCAVLGVAVLAIQNEYGFVKTIFFAFVSSVGYGLALILLTGIRERLNVAPIPVHLKGTSIGLITVGLLALAFLGFAGMVH
ncbi:MAG: electron transport complex subunit RsxA [Deltaproteobacteria bacterium]|nr:electron transport complex subunit RsxA [Deltaproteobacteria bacterium]MBW1921953.1 electron transport complex subunit RsxA [Deltaproteobacteria bacterium]MBW1948779.1 electron transport complex subunit RsxA [Deltaproteobacteria bacterium]MBW2006456.1 electron transport complex subunit RsxA [Deltaproteobacteria bacterium]MBW2346321.1 electron transport complex subunit RsxA [Deltaproteobacteria bacterium]